MLRYLLVLFCLLQATSSHADCSGSYSTSSNIQLSLTVPGPNAPLITPLSPWVASTVGIFYGCKANEPLIIGISAGTRFTGSYFTDPADGKVYPIYVYYSSTLPEAVGYITGAGPVGGTMQPALQQGGSNIPAGTMNEFNTNADATGQAYATYKVRAIRIAALQNTNSINGMGYTYFVPFWRKPTDATFSNNYSRFNAPNPAATFTNSIFQTCSVLSSNLQVTLPKVDAIQLNSINSTTGNTAFNLPLYCPSPVNLFMTITDKSNPGQISNIISLTSDSSAKGVGIQIQRNGQPVYMGPDSSVANNTNQFQVGSTSGTVNLPFSANYIRTGTITAGSVKAITTFTLSYQ